METKKYVKKPVIVSAYQTDKDIIIHTLEGDMHAKKGDYIITGINGEKYPCKPDIFEKTYEAVDSVNHGWISVNDRLPVDQEEVFVCTLSKKGTRNIDKGYMSIDHFIHRGCAQVTHWMPLPKFPD